MASSLAGSTPFVCETQYLKSRHQLQPTVAAAASVAR